MLRYQVFLFWGVLWGAIWFQALKNQDELVPKSPLSPDTTKFFIKLFPVWIIVALAMYAASTILYGLATLGDFPEAATELEKEIKEAKAEMKKRGVPIVE